VDASDLQALDLGCATGELTKIQTYNMEIKNIEKIEADVVQYEFVIYVAGERIPCVLWTPEKSASSPALIAMGHGGSQHKKSDNIIRRGIHYAQKFGWTTLSIDTPKHGERIGIEEAQFESAKTLARIQGNPIVPSLSIEEKIKYLDDLTMKAVPEWQAALDSVFESNIIEKYVPIAYCGLSQGSSIGIPLLAADNRFCYAVLGLTHLHPNHFSLALAAKNITIPIRFVFQWDDTIRDRNYGLALFDIFESRKKSMHIYTGGHDEMPTSETDSWDQFFLKNMRL
jgi:hypothetical protein